MRVFSGDLYAVAALVAGADARAFLMTAPRVAFARVLRGPTSLIAAMLPVVVGGAHCPVPVPGRPVPGPAGCLGITRSFWPTPARCAARPSATDSSARSLFSTRVISDSSCCDSVGSGSGRSCDERTCNEPLRLLPPACGMVHVPLSADIPFLYAPVCVASVGGYGRLSKSNSPSDELSCAMR